MPRELESASVISEIAAEAYRRRLSEGEFSLDDVVGDVESSEILLSIDPEQFRQSAIRSVVESVDRKMGRESVNDPQMILPGFSALAFDQRIALPDGHRVSVGRASYEHIDTHLRNIVENRDRVVASANIKIDELNRLKTMFEKNPDAKCVEELVA
jgi:hypothetical protein